MSIAHRNLIRDPRFHANITDGWHMSDFTVKERDASPPVALPDGCDAALHLQTTAGNQIKSIESLSVGGQDWDIPIDGGPCNARFAAYVPPVAGHSRACKMEVLFWGAEGSGPLGSIVTLPVTSASDAAFHEYVLEDITPPEGAITASVWLLFGDNADTVARDFWVTEIMLDDASGTSEGYGDGDAGYRWAWTGAEHDSYSEQADVEGIFATTELVGRPAMGGQGVDVLDAEWNIDRKGGFTSATVDVVPPKSTARFADAVNEPIEIRDPENGHLLWEGRVEEPDLAYVEADKLTIEATGYIGYLTDNEYFRRLYVDGALDSWQLDQATKYADRFSVAIEDDDKLCLRVSCYGGDPGQTLVDGANCRAYWQLFDGVPTDQSIKGLKFHYEADSFDSSLRCRLYGRDALSGGSVNRTLWTSPAAYQPSGDVTLSAEDIGDDVTVLVFRLEQVGSVITSYTDLTGGSVDSWSIVFGIALSDLRVYASDLHANVTPERIVRDAVLSVCDDDHIDFPDTSSFTLGHVDFSDPTTVQQDVEDIDAMLDWDYGMLDGQVFHYRRPWAALTIPDGELVVTSHADPNLVSWDVRYSYADCYNRVAAQYTKRNGRIGAVTVQSTEGPLGSTWRTKYVDLTSTCDNLTDATLVANAYLDACLWPKPTGPIVMKGTAHLAAGIDVPAIYLRPGMRIVNVDETRAHIHRLLITSVTGRLVAREITLNVGTRSTQLDRILAQRGLEAKRKPRKRRHR